MSSTTFPKAPKQQPRRVCAFCGGGGVSNEHFWPEWAGPLLPNGRELTYFEYSQHNFADGTPRKPSRYMKRQGPVINKTVRAPCVKCNTGWMSRLEAAVQPILTPLAKGEPKVLTVEDQLILARWVCLKTMAAESNLRGEQVTFRHERHRFRRTLDIPSGFSVWLLRCGERHWRAAYRRHATNVHPVRAAGGHRPNFQMITFGFGEVLFVTITSRVVGLRMNLPLMPGGAFRFWPAIADPIAWPPKISVTAEGAEYIATTLTRLKGPLRIDSGVPISPPR